MGLACDDYRVRRKIRSIRAFIDRIEPTEIVLKPGVLNSELHLEIRPKPIITYRVATCHNVRVTVSHAP